MTRNEKIKFLIIRSIGNFLLFFSIYGVVATFGPALAYEVHFRLVQARGIEYTVQEESTPQQAPVSGGGFGVLLGSSTKQYLIPKDTNFSILIPKIGANERVIPNVDPDNSDEYIQKLQEGVAHAKGTVFPGMDGVTYLFAHSADNWWNVGRYNAVFYLLKDLQKGDDIFVYFENRRYNYTMTDTFIGESSDVEFLVNGKGSGQQLVLQTCWPPGTTWKRLFVVAKPKSI